MLEEVQRRNRRRIAALSLGAFVNYWLVTSFFAALVSYGWASKIAGDDAQVPVLPVLLLGAAIGALITIGTTLGRLQRVAEATVAELGATVIGAEEDPRLHNLSVELAIAAGIQPVRMAVLQDPVPNALTVGAGPDHASIVVTTGMLEQLTRDELEAVLAVQMCEVKRLDVALQTAVMVCAAGAIGIHRSYRERSNDPRNWLWIAVTWPSMVLAEVLRRRAFGHCDFGADDMAIAMTRHPEALLRALVKLLDDGGTVRAVTPANALLWFEPVPLGVEAELARTRYSVTPPLDARITRLMALTDMAR